LHKSELVIAVLGGHQVKSGLSKQRLSLLA
jgi:hypothetical protein